MKLTNTLIILSILIISLGCDQDENSLMKFSGITVTDEQGVSTGYTDITDWNLDDTWTDKEEAIFGDITLSSIKKETNSTVDISIQPAFPNPCADYVNLSFSLTPGTVFHIALVNQNLDVISYISIDDPERTMISYDLSQHRLKNNSIYRFYYKFVSGGAEFKGHGDIKFEE